MGSSTAEADHTEGEQRSDDQKQSRNKEEKGDRGGDGKQGRKRSIWPFIILGILVVLLIAAGLVYYFLTADLVSTDDAYTEGRAIPVAAKVSGYVDVLNVNDNTHVKAGDLLVRIDPRDYVTARDQARANLAMTEAQLSSSRTQLEEARVRAPASLRQAQAQLDQARANQNQAQQDFRRQQNVDPRATTQQNVDQANSNFRGNNAAVTAAEAQVQISSLVAQLIADAQETVNQRLAQVEQARANLHAATANVGVQVAMFYPDVSLSGSLGLRATDASYLTSWASHFYSAGPSVSLPIFQGGRLTANLRLARAQQAEMALKYRGTVLNALQEVENAFVAYHDDRIARDRSRDTATTAGDTLYLATSRYRNGLTDFLNVLNAQMTLTGARQNLARAEVTLVNDVVTLYRALGGGWSTQALPRVQAGPPPLPAAIDGVAAQ